MGWRPFAVVFHLVYFFSLQHQDKVKWDQVRVNTEEEFAVQGRIFIIIKLFRNIKMVSLLILFI